ncbi:response regulator transcription factor [Ktedonobacter racemifer]|uniref:Response regulator receiver protein n=1 Tax=Ktedonobacter racemifer DSM 44963 TaxID=485913 RepID=D6TV82_KTERA|nr:response regulator transcription factor [Ktedonobacter racemifer]EFH84182.1 response regulator receiver protein [Ktedonobacter racemifer DSM 44963]
MTISNRYFNSMETYKQKGGRVKDMAWDLERRAVTIGDTTIVLTSTEYRLLFSLRHGNPVTYANLALMAYNCKMDTKVRMMMDKHIDRIRSKLRGTGIYVYCVNTYGYLLLPEAF